VTEPRTLRCDHCGAPVEFESSFCAYCRARLRWGGTLDVEPGEALVSLDLTREPLPGGAALKKHVTTRSDGALVTLDHGTLSGSLPLKLRDACVAASAVVSNVETGFGVTARLHQAGSASSCYSLMVNPSVRAYRVQRLLWSKNRTYVDTLRNWEVTPHLHGLGTLNRVELRYADSVLQVVLNGARAASLVDARFGFGAVGWRVVAYEDLPKDKQILFYRFDVARVL
jgi:hypothetical protein